MQYQVQVRSYNGHYPGLSIQRREFDSPTHRQISIPPLAQWQSNRLITDRQKFNSSTEDQKVFRSEWNNGVLAGCNPVAFGQVGSIPTHSTKFRMRSAKKYIELLIQTVKKHPVDCIYNMCFVRVRRMARQRIANPYNAGSIPVTYSIQKRIYSVEPEHGAWA